MRRAWLFVPLAVFVALAALLLRGFYLDDPHDLPSALIGEPLPRFELPRLHAPETRVTTADLEGRVALLNVWATWCPTCRAEHDALARITEATGIPIYGINYKDDPAEARRWLERYGDPYAFSIVDRDGSLGIDLGVYGAPETFLLDAAGVIRYKRVGDVNARIWRDELKPALEAVLGRRIEAAPFPGVEGRS